jgi:hypothetical protein
VEEIDDQHKSASIVGSAFPRRSASLLENTMTLQQIVGLITRLFAIWLFVSGIQMIGVGMSLRDSVGQGAGGAGAAYVVSIVFCATAFIVWRHPLLIARKLIPTAPDDISNSISAAETATVACIVLGLWTLVGRFLPAPIQDLVIVAVYRANYQPLQSLAGKDLLRLIESAVDLVVALILIFKARWIAAYLLRPSPTVIKG